MASEDASLATLAEEPANRETSSSGTAVVIHHDQQKVHAYRMPQTLSTRMVPLPVEQGDVGVKEVLSGLLADKLENALKTSQAADKREKRQHGDRRSKNRPGKSRHRYRGTKSSAVSSTPDPAPARSADVANAGTEASMLQLQEDEAKEASEKVNATASRRSTRRKQRFVRQKRRERHQLRGGEPPKKLVVAAQPGGTSALGGSPPPHPTHAATIATSIWSPNQDSTVVDTPCSRLCAMMCALALMGCVAAVMTALAFSTVKVIGQRDRIMRDFNNWTLEQFAMARAAAVATTTTALAVPVNSTWGGSTNDTAKSRRMSTTITT